MSEGDVFCQELGHGEFQLTPDGKGWAILQQAGWKYMDLFKFIGDKLLWTGPASNPKASAIVRRDPPNEGHFYALDLIVLAKREGAKTKKLELSATSCEELGPVLSGILPLCRPVEDDDAAAAPADITLKCFASTPRAPLPTLTTSTLSHLPSNSTAGSILRLQFVALNEATCHVLLESSSQQISHLELRQSTIQGMDQALQSHPHSGPSSWSLSLSQQEFSRISGSFGGGNTAIRSLTLQLHFALAGTAGSPMQTFIEQSLASNAGLESLSLEYLDISDELWLELCLFLKTHPKLTTLRLAFTDSFADEARRLTPERRRLRSQAILDLVQANPRIQSVEWPSFQQDADVVAVMTGLLESRNKSS